MKRCEGMRTTQRNRDTEAPMDKSHYVKVLEGKGRPATKAERKWLQVSTGAELADYEGVDGQPRYWIAQVARQ